MLAVYSPMSVGDYCKSLNDGLITVNEEYQRNAGIWASYARSFFIESILLEYPIPKIFLYSKVDLRTRSTIKEIVDGQQRSHALQYFYNKRYKLSSKIETEELRGKNYNQLSEEFQSKFISYSLPIDEFRGVQPVEIQDSFRRMNASNVPLNDEEQRNAKFQGHSSGSYSVLQIGSLNLFALPGYLAAGTSYEWRTPGFTRRSFTLF